MDYDLLTTIIEPDHELTLVDYMNELDMVVKPALRVLYELEDDAFNMRNQDLKCLLFTVIHTWENIDKLFMGHNRKIHGLPERVEDVRDFRFGCDELDIERGDAA